MECGRLARIDRASRPIVALPPAETAGGRGRGRPHSYRGAVHADLADGLAGARFFATNARFGAAARSRAATALR